MYYNKSTRKRDSNASDAVTQFIYENLYKHIYKEPYIVENTVAQKAGIDIWDADTNVTIKLLGGDLKIKWESYDSDVYMDGPATVVFDGEVDI